MMNNLKKIAGIVWILLGPISIYYLVKTAAIEISKNRYLKPRFNGLFLCLFLSQLHSHGADFARCPTTHGHGSGAQSRDCGSCCRHEAGV